MNIIAMFLLAKLMTVGCIDTTDMNYQALKISGPPTQRLKVSNAELFVYETYYMGKRKLKGVLWRLQNPEYVPPAPYNPNNFRPAFQVRMIDPTRFPEEETRLIKPESDRLLLAFDIKSKSSQEVLGFTFRSIGEVDLSGLNLKLTYFREGGFHKEDGGSLNAFIQGTQIKFTSEKPLKVGQFETRFYLSVEVPKDISVNLGEFIQLELVRINRSTYEISTNGETVGPNWQPISGKHPSG